MNHKINIEKIKLLLPDYLTGLLSEEETRLVEEALASSDELKQLCSDMKNALEFAARVHVEEPAPQYWNNLLPRIHEKIEEREKKALAKSPVTYIWKILLPAAAVVLIFFVYKIAFTPDNQITKEEKNIINEKVENKDTVQLKVEKKFNQEQVEEKLEKEKSQIRKVKKEKLKRMTKEENLADITNKKEIEEKKEAVNQHNGNEEIASFADVDEISIFGAGTPGTYDEDIENELDKLNTNDQDNLLEELSKSNL